MRVVRGRADARWLPSRHRFGLFRLWAFLRLRMAKPEPRPALMLIVDRDQTAFEHHAMSLWVVVTVTCYVAATWFAAWPVPLALAAALPVAAVLIEVPIYVGGLVLKGGARLNGVVFVLLLAGASAYVARQATWGRFVAWLFFGVVALDVAAAAIVFLLRGPIAQLERGVTSEL